MFRCGERYDRRTVILLGVDPGARSTGLALVQTGDGTTTPRGLLLWSATITNPGALLPVDRTYLLDVLGAIVDATRAARTPVDLIGLEEVSRPRQHLDGKRARDGRGGAAADPTALLGTAEVRGAVAGRHYGCPVVNVAAGKHGQNDLRLYPPALLDTGGLARPGGKRRHERAAYDIALAAPAYARMAAVGGH